MSKKLSVSDLSMLIENNKLKYEVNNYSIVIHTKTKERYSIKDFCIRESDLEVCVVFCKEHETYIKWCRPIKEMFEEIQITQPRFIKD